MWKWLESQAVLILGMSNVRVWDLQTSYMTLFFKIFLLGIFLIYIFNAIPTVPQPLPQSHTYQLPLFGPGIPLYWGI